MKNKNSIILTTTDTIYGKKIKSVLGLVQGNTVQAKSVIKDIIAGWKGLIGGEIKSYTKLLTQSRDKAISNMIEEAQKLGANAIVGLRFSTSSIMPTMSEVMVYGTAVKLDK